MENNSNVFKSRTTNAERCKRYRERHSDEYKENDAIRKKRSRVSLKSDPVAYEQYKRKERERKRYATPVFSNNAVKSRSVKKVEKVLPKSPRRKKEIIKSLASKFNIRINLEKSERKKKGIE